VPQAQQHAAVDADLDACLGTCIRQHTSAYVSMRQHMLQAQQLADVDADLDACRGTCVKAAYVSIRQHASAYAAGGGSFDPDACLGTRISKFVSR
jgi:hypothetical protein